LGNTRAVVTAGLASGTVGSSRGAKRITIGHMNGNFARNLSTIKTEIEVAPYLSDF
jgi:hypothetical protein